MVISTLRTFVLFISFITIAALGGLVVGVVLTVAGALFYHTGFQFPVSFYASAAFIIWTIGKYQMDRNEYKPKPEPQPIYIPSPRHYRQGPLIRMS
jgi:hypothetical protein